jgi:catechol 2,3-dioxygenase-like lactoylglutathione lyase family enzyme
MILWLLLALSLAVSSVHSQSIPKTNARASVTSAARARIPAFSKSEAQFASLVKGVESVGMTVSDMDRAVEFYSKVLSFEKLSDTEVTGEQYEQLQGVFGLRMRVVRMKLGDEIIELTEYLAPKGRPVPADSRSNDRWFQHIAIITSDMDRAYAWLRQHKVQHASTGPQRIPDWNKGAAGIRAFYFKDPDGHTLEVLQFPPDKGKSKWHDAQKNGDKLFLGIDHTAIVVGDTESSLKFYRDVLGMTVAGHGTEQEHLNNVFGARLRITSLKAEFGPSIEFLEYLAPRDGRLARTDTKANDLVYWQTRLVVGDTARAAQVLQTAKTTFLSSGVISLTEPTLGFIKGFVTLDPDGHALQVVEK